MSIGVLGRDGKAVAVIKRATVGTRYMNMRNFTVITNYIIIIIIIIRVITQWL
jgi:hypothetical protein